MFGQRQADCIGNPGNVDEAVDDLTDDSPFEGGLNIVPPIVRTVLRERGSEERLPVHVIPNAEGVDENGPVGTKKVSPTDNQSAFTVRYPHLNLHKINGKQI